MGCFRAGLPERVINWRSRGCKRRADASRNAIDAKKAAGLQVFFKGAAELRVARVEALRTRRGVAAQRAHLRCRG